MDDDEEDDLINPGSPTPFEDDISDDEGSLDTRSPPPIQSTVSSSAITTVADVLAKYSVTQNSLVPRISIPSAIPNPAVSLSNIPRTVPNSANSTSAINDTSSPTDSIHKIILGNTADQILKTAKEISSITSTANSTSPSSPPASLPIGATLSTLTTPLNTLNSHLTMSTLPFTSPPTSSTNLQQVLSPALTIASLVSSHKRPASPTDHYMSPIRPIPERFHLSPTSIPPISKRPFTLSPVQSLSDRHFMSSAGAFTPIRLQSKNCKEERESI